MFNWNWNWAWHKSSKSSKRRERPGWLLLLGVLAVVWRKDSTGRLLLLGVLAVLSEFRELMHVEIVAAFIHNFAGVCSKLEISKQFPHPHSLGKAYWS